MILLSAHLSLVIHAIVIFVNMIANCLLFLYKIMYDNPPWIYIYFCMFYLRFTKVIWIHIQLIFILSIQPTCDHPNCVSSEGYQMYSRPEEYHGQEVTISIHWDHCNEKALKFPKSQVYGMGVLTIEVKTDETRIIVSSFDWKCCLH